MKISKEQAVDRLGNIQAQMADLKNEQAALKQLLQESGEKVVEGQLFRASIADKVRRSLEMKAIRKKLTPQFMRAHTIETHYTEVKVSARKGV